MTTEKLTRLQMRIMQSLWDRSRAVARDITDDLNRFEPIAHSTVQTLLRRLERRGVIGHDAEGPTFVYYPIARNENVVRQAIDEFLGRIFAGSPRGMVSYLLKHRLVSPEELRERSERADDKDKNP